MDESFLCHSRLELTDDLENLDTHSSDNPGRILPAESPERPTQLANRPLPLPLRSSTVYTVLSPDSGPLEVTSPFQSVEHSLGAVARLYCPAGVYEVIFRYGFWEGKYSDQLEMNFEQLISLAKRWNADGSKTNADSPKKIPILFGRRSWSSNNLESSSMLSWLLV